MFLPQINITTGTKMYGERSKKKTFCLHCTIIVPRSLLHSLSTIIRLSYTLLTSLIQFLLSVNNQIKKKPKYNLMQGQSTVLYCTVLYCTVLCRCGCWPACCWCSSPWWSTPSSSAGSSSTSATSRSGGRTRSRRRSRRPPLRCEIGRQLFTTQ